MKLTINMAGIIVSLAEMGPTDPIAFKPFALVRLAREGYVDIGASARLTLKGLAIVAKCNAWMNEIYALQDAAWEDCSFTKEETKERQKAIDRMRLDIAA